MASKATFFSFEQATTREKKIPRSWLRAIGLLKKKKVNPLGYQKRKRAEWGK